MPVHLTRSMGDVSIVPQLSVRRGRDAVEFYKTAFGAIEVYRVGGTDENPSVVSQLAVGTTSFWVADESPPNRNFSPDSLGGSTVRLLLEQHVVLAALTQPDHFFLGLPPRRDEVLVTAAVAGALFPLSLRHKASARLPPK